MKFKLHGMVFSLLFALGLVFSFSIEAGGSHGDGQGKKAEDVDPGSQGQMEMFLAHIVDYYDDVYDENVDADFQSQSRAVAIYSRQIRQPGPYHHEDTYSITINPQTMRVVNHAKYPGLLGYSVNLDAENSAVAGALKTLLDNEMADCKKYGQNDERVACATRLKPLVGPAAMIVGIHHAEDDAAFEPPDCRSLGFELETSAEDVYTSTPAEAEDNLKAYVKDIIGVTRKAMQDVTTAVITEDEGALFQRVLGGDPDASSTFKIKVIIPS